MERKLLSELNLNDKFKLFKDGVIWTVIDTAPVIYSNAIRAKSGKITAPFSKNILCFTSFDE